MVSQVNPSDSIVVFFLFYDRVNHLKVVLNCSDLHSTSLLRLQQNPGS